MNTKDTSGPAFPCNSVATQQYDWVRTGMTLRDYFAAKAMAAFIQASTSINDNADYSFGSAEVLGVNTPQSTFGHDNERMSFARLWSEEAYCMADAMLAAREVE